MMNRMEKLISTLPEEDVRKVKEWKKNHPEEVPENLDEEVDTLIHSILWDYRVKAEAATSGQEARKIEQQKAELYSKWKEMGIIKD